MASKKIIVASVLLLAKSTTALQSTDGLVLLQHRSEVTKGSKLATAGLGNTVATTEIGYQEVARLKSDVDMEAFIRRVLDAEARVVTDEAELTGLVPFYSGSQAVQSLDSLKKELRSVAWVGMGAGRSAPLSEEGYKQVASTKSKANMMAFARRILDANFVKATDEGALKGMVPYFSGEVAVQSFDQLKKELLSAPFVVARVSEEEVMGDAHPISLVENKFWPFTGADETKSDEKDETLAEGNKSDNKKAAKANANATKQDENTKVIKLAAKPASCDDWCVGELFVKVESNVTVMKNISSWAMKCTWAHCSSCSDCSGVSTLVAERTKNDVATKLSSASKQASCDDWCSSEVFTAVNQNVTSVKNFTWEMKCGWANCGACEKCSSKVALLNEDLDREERPVETTVATIEEPEEAALVEEEATTRVEAEVEAAYESENVEAAVTAASESDKVEEEDEATAEEVAEQLEESTSEAAAVDAVAAEAPADKQSAEAAPAKKKAAPAEEVAAPATRAASKQPSEETPYSKAASKEPPADEAVPSKTQASKNASPDNSKDAKASGTVSSTHQKKSPMPSHKTEAKTSKSNGFFHWLSR